MIKEVILRQKIEKESYLNRQFIERKSLNLAKNKLDSDLIKVIIGPRRAGKSVFAFMLLKGKNFAYLNFDDEGLADLTKHNYDSIIDGLIDVYGKTEFIFFDEIQNLDGWELFVNRLHRQGYNLVLTGSNANLLSRELASSLTGRHISIEVLPFSYTEYLLAKSPSNQSDNDLVNDFLLNGGYPEVVIKDMSANEYLDVLFDSILFKDIVKRHKIRFPQKISDLGNYLIDSHAGAYTVRKLLRTLEFRSSVTVEKYLKYLSDAYLLFYLNRLSFKSKERSKSPKKVYAIDNGLIKAKSVKHSPDWGRLMENMVFLELLKSGSRYNFDLFYYKTEKNGKEIDFVIKSGQKAVELIQVAYEINVKNKDREISALLEAANELQCDNLSVVTLNQSDNLDYGSKKIKVISLGDWLAGEGISRLYNQVKK